MKDHHAFMELALNEAKKAFNKHEIPVGAVLVRNGEVLCATHNQVEEFIDVSAHAELLAIKKASELLQEKYLSGCTLYVTLEPCAMCTGALIWSKIDRIVYGALDAKVGACGSRYNLAKDTNQNHSIEIIHGILEDECESLLKSFFSTLRK